MQILIDHAYRAEDTEQIPIERLARFVLENEGMPADAEVSISFVSDEDIADLNEAYRGKVGPTDVLSFECDTVEDDIPVAFLEEAPVYELGDIVIAPDVAERQCAEYGNALRGEIQLLLVHGLLHLCGYDHIEDGEAQLMERRERELLAEWVRESGEDRIER